MAKNVAVVLSKESEAFIEQQIAQGRCNSAEDALQRGLQLLEEREAKLEALRAAIIEGEHSGPAEPFDLEEFLDEMRNESGKSHTNR